MVNYSTLIITNTNWIICTVVYFIILISGDWVEKPDSNMNISTNFPPPPPKLSSPWSAQFTSGANIRTEYFEETKPYQIEDFFKYSEKYRNATKGTHCCLTLRNAF